MPRIKIINIFRHLHTINKHRWFVFKLCVKAGIPLRGLKHDLSKYSPVEFWEGVRYYQGTRSPVLAAIDEKGYSKAWLHHKGRNSHHPDYWYDYRNSSLLPTMPYKYSVEMICDGLAAGMVYEKDKWDKTSQLKYWNRENIKNKISPESREFFTEVYSRISEEGVDKVLNKKVLKEIYIKHIGVLK